MYQGTGRIKSLYRDIVINESPIQRYWREIIARSRVLAWVLVSHYCLRNNYPDHTLFYYELQISILFLLSLLLRIFIVFYYNSLFHSFFTLLQYMFMFALLFITCRFKSFYFNQRTLKFYYVSPWLLVHF